MIAKTEILRARVNAKTKARAEKVFRRIGLTPTEGVNLFFAQVALKNGIPFMLTATETDDGYLPHVPNAETSAALQEPAGNAYGSHAAFMRSLKNSGHANTKKHAKV